MKTIVNLRDESLGFHNDRMKSKREIKRKWIKEWLSRFSRVQLCVTPQTAAHQAPLSLGFSRQEHWSRLPFSSPMHESETEVSQSCPTLRDPLDCSLPGSSVPWIFLARVLEWGATAFSHKDFMVTLKYALTYKSTVALGKY